MNASRNPLDLSLILGSQPRINGLENLRSYLERSCYSKVGIKEWMSDEQRCGLVVSLECPLALGDLLHHFKAGTWGNITRSESLPCCDSDWYYLFNFLEVENGIPVDIEELNLQLQDTLIIIQKTGPKSIIQGWAYIFDLLCEHYNEVTQGGNRVPFEIYLTVQEESNASAEQADYGSFWAIYREGSSHSIIYDLQERQFRSEELHFIGKGTDY